MSLTQTLPWHHRDLLIYAFVIKSSQEEIKKENKELIKEKVSEVTTSKLSLQVCHRDLLIYAFVIKSSQKERNEENKAL